jgi:hypothetical protein
MLSRGNAIQTASGSLYYPGAPHACDVEIEDIASSLSKMCRFGGHCSRFYSVAEHSVLVSQVVPPEHALCALLHDATEAYCVDVPRPLKLMLSNYAEIEELNWLAVAARFDLPDEMPDCIKHADNAVLMAEKAALMVGTQGVWPDIEPARVRISGFAPRGARAFFMTRYAELIRSRR